VGAIGSVAVLASHVKGGKLRAIAVTGQKRSHTMPYVPSLSEQGFPGFNALAWWGIFAPAGTPTAIVERLNAEIGRALKVPAVHERMMALGMRPAGSTPAQLSERVRRDIEYFSSVAKAAGLRSKQAERIRRLIMAISLVMVGPGLSKRLCPRER